MIDFIISNFVNLSVINGIFGFVFDMGCFHHVTSNNRNYFIEGINRVLKENGYYMVKCFSYKNGPSWNHFTKKQLIQIFSKFFLILKIIHYPSIKDDGIKRFFYTLLMKKPVS